jgi:uncharacterized protein (TIGR03435 family)
MNVARQITLAVVAMAAVARPSLPAQNSASQTPRFEVVSVKRNTSGGAGGYWGLQPGGRFMASNTSVRQLIRTAFGLQPYQLTGDADWLQSERYDIQAKAPDGDVATGEAMNVMLQAMLADRFTLKARRETRESPVYELVVARGDGRLGEHLRQTSADCVANLGRGTLGPLPPLIGPRDPLPCGVMNSGGNRLYAGGRTMAQLATMLVPQVQRMVVDKTGLTGLYDFDLQFLPDPVGGGRTADGAVVRFLPAGDDVPPLMTAIEQQLGLKLQATRGAVEYLVIESIERPMED